LAHIIGRVDNRRFIFLDSTTTWRIVPNNIR
jgi:hypothetical protein